MLALLGLCGAPRDAWAEPSTTVGEKATKSPNAEGYDALLDRAVEAFDAEDYAKARASFEQAYALRPNARVLRGMGLSALQLERFTLAKRELTAALAETRQPLTAPQRTSVNEVLSWMRTHLASLQLHLRPPSAMPIRVELDGEAVMIDSELWIEPGAHRLRVSATGYDAFEQAFHVGAGENLVRQIVLTKRGVEPTALALAPSSPAPALSSQPAPARDDSTPVLESWWFWTAVGVVVAGGVATTVALTSKPASQSYEPGGLGGVMMPLELRRSP